MLLYSVWSFIQFKIHLMKKYILIALVLISFCSIKGQIIKGKVIDSKDGSYLQYASLGLINTSVGTITNEYGEFNLETCDSTKKSIVRFSMIGYQNKSFSVEELYEKENIIKLEKKITQIEEVVISANKETAIIGTNSSTPKSVSGWGGDKFGQGHEIGIRMNLGDSYVNLQSLSFKAYKQSFDSTMFRLHVRNIAEDKPNEELIDTNILFTVSNPSGWKEITLKQYDLFLKGDIVVSLEWIKVWGLNEKNMVKMNRSKQKRAVFLLANKKNSGQMYVKRGVEANWKSSMDKTPSIYLIVK